MLDLKEIYIELLKKKNTVRQCKWHLPGQPVANLLVLTSQKLNVIHLSIRLCKAFYNMALT